MFESKMNSLTVGSMLIAALALATTAQAVTVSFGSSVATLTNSTGFEHASSRIDLPSKYIEDGIQVEQLGQVAGDWVNTAVMHDIYPGMGFSGLRTWYPSAGDNGHTKISLVGGAGIQELSLQVGNGHGDSDGITGVTGSTIGNWGQRVSLNFAVYNHGSLVDSGSLLPNGKGAILMMVSDGGFDSITLSATYGAYSPESGQFQALAIDNLQVLSSIPELAPQHLLAIGLPLIAFLRLPRFARKSRRAAV